MQFHQQTANLEVLRLANNKLLIIGLCGVDRYVKLQQYFLSDKIKQEIKSLTLYEKREANQMQRTKRRLILIYYSIFQEKNKKKLQKSDNHKNCKSLIFSVLTYYLPLYWQS